MVGFEPQRNNSSTGSHENAFDSKDRIPRGLPSSCAEWLQEAEHVAQLLERPKWDKPVEVRNLLSRADALAEQALDLFASSKEYCFLMKSISIELLLRMQPADCEKQLASRAEDLSAFHRSHLSSSPVAEAIVHVAKAAAENDMGQKVVQNDTAHMALAEALTENTVDSPLMHLAERQLLETGLFMLRVPVCMLGSSQTYPERMLQVRQNLQLLLPEKLNQVFTRALNVAMQTVELFLREDGKEAEVFQQLQAAQLLAKQLPQDPTRFFDLSAKAILHGLYIKEHEAVQSVAEHLVSEIKEYGRRLLPKLTEPIRPHNTTTQKAVEKAFTALEWFADTQEDGETIDSPSPVSPSAVASLKGDLAKRIYRHACLAEDRGVKLKALVFYFTSVFKNDQWTGDETSRIGQEKLCFKQIERMVCEVPLMEPDGGGVNAAALEERVAVVAAMGEHYAAQQQYDRALDLVRHFDLEKCGKEMIAARCDSFLHSISDWARRADQVESYITMYQTFAEVVAVDPERADQKIKTFARLADMFHFLGDVESTCWYGVKAVHLKRKSLNESKFASESARALESVWHLIEIVDLAVNFYLDKTVVNICDEIAVRLFECEHEGMPISDWFLKQLGQSHLSCLNFAELAEHLAAQKEKFTFVTEPSVPHQWLKAAVAALQLRSQVSQSLEFTVTYLEHAYLLVSLLPDSPCAEKVALMKQLLRATSPIDFQSSDDDEFVFEPGRIKAMTTALLPEARQDDDYSLDALYAGFLGQIEMSAEHYENASRHFERGLRFCNTAAIEGVEVTAMAAKLGICYHNQLLALESLHSENYDEDKKRLETKANEILALAIDGFDRQGRASTLLLRAVHALTTIRSQDFNSLESSPDDYSLDDLRVKEIALIRQLGLDNTDDDLGFHV